MNANKSSISQKSTYQEIGEYWDTHELPEDCREVEFTVELDSRKHYFAIENSLSENLRAVAKRHGVSAETLINLWVKEKLNSEMART